MQVIRTPREMQQQCEQWRCAGETIGFVPTMGALHEGHLSLVQRAKKENSKVVVSIFVNPTQFRPGEDFRNYPRPFDRDCEFLQCNDCDAVFSPDADAMYGSRPVTVVEVGSLSSPNSQLPTPNSQVTVVEVGSLSTRWEGAARPGHFNGVATVVAKLFNIVRARRAYFGEKDFQQLEIIEAMARGLNFETEVVPCPTVREDDGLAMSSRNAYLSAEERAAAPVIFRALCAAQTLAQNGERSGENLAAAMRAVLEREPILQAEYSAIVDSQTLEPLGEITNEKPARAIIAARAGSTRLIDNIAINVI